MRYLILLFCVIFSTVSLSQENNQDNSSNALGFFNKVKDSMSIENFQFDVNKLKFFGIENDTILLDTSLNINKYYQFNYRKKDNFEFLKFNNIGQVYNKLSYSPNNNFLPKIGFSANKMLLIGQEDYKFYDVAYPLTELFFKTVYSQGQLTDALFTTNINKNTNFLLAFKALRSLGKYQNSLSGSKHFRFGFSFIKNNLDSKIFFSSQKLEKHENGGLNDTSLIDFESGDPEFKERSKLNVNFEDAVNTYQTRNFYFKNNYTLLNKNKNYISIIYNLDYETTNNKYEQEQASYLYGSLISGLSEVNDHYKFRSLKNVIELKTKSSFFDELTLGYINYNYNFFEINQSDEKIASENSSLFSGSVFKKIGNININFDITQKIKGDRIGNEINFILKSNDKTKFNYLINLNLGQSHPGLIYDIYNSDYSNINFERKNKLIENKSLNIKLNKKSIGSVSFSLLNVTNQFYLTVNSDIENKLTPIANQYNNQINIIKFRYSNEIKFGKFSLDNTILLQNVDQEDSIINLPKILTRNTLYISEKIFNNVMDIQTGISLKIFSKFYANEYNPLLSTFHIQSLKKIGGYPLLDFFINAKIRQTRIFLKAEHFNSSISSGNFMSSPTSPYRDSSIRFGLRWNLFN